MTAPIPVKSPEPEYDGTSTPSGVYRAVQSTAFSTKVQWGAIGAVVLSIATFVGWAINKMDVVNTASAQTQATANAALEQSKDNRAQIQAVDAGTRLAIENLRREMADDRASTDRKLDAILREVKKK